MNLAGMCDQGWPGSPGIMEVYAFPLNPAIGGTAVKTVQKLFYD